MCEGDSTLITSAPKSPSRQVPSGPAQPLVRSTTRNGLVMISLLDWQLSAVSGQLQIQRGFLKEPPSLASVSHPHSHTLACCTRPRPSVRPKAVLAAGARAAGHFRETVGRESLLFHLRDVRSQEKTGAPSGAAIPPLRLASGWATAESLAPGRHGRFPISCASGAKEVRRHVIPWNARRVQSRR